MLSDDKIKFTAAEEIKKGQVVYLSKEDGMLHVDISEKEWLTKADIVNLPVATRIMFDSEYEGRIIEGKFLRDHLCFYGKAIVITHFPSGEYFGRMFSEGLLPFRFKVIEEPEEFVLEKCADSLLKIDGVSFSLTENNYPNFDEMLMSLKEGDKIAVRKVDSDR